MILLQALYHATCTCIYYVTRNLKLRREQNKNKTRKWETLWEAFPTPHEYQRNVAYIFLCFESGAGGAH